MQTILPTGLSRLNPFAAIKRYKASKSASSNQSAGRSISSHQTRDKNMPSRSESELKAMSRKDILTEYAVTKSDRVMTFLKTTAIYTTAGAAGGAIWGAIAGIVCGEVIALPIGAAIGGGIGLAGGTYTGFKQARRLTPEIKIKTRLIKVRKKVVPLNKKLYRTTFTCGALITEMGKHSSNAEYREINKPNTNEGWDTLHAKVNKQLTEMDGQEYLCKADKKKQKALKKLEAKLSERVIILDKKSKIDPEETELKIFMETLEKTKPENLTA